jgi:restriction system protein
MSQRTLPFGRPRAIVIPHAHGSEELMAKQAMHGVEMMVLMRWPVGVLIGLVVCLATHYGSGSHAALMPVGGHEHDLLAWTWLGACWLVAAFTAPGYRQRRHRLDIRHQLDRLAALPQATFEENIIEAFHRRGYVVEDSLRDEAGLAELLLYRNGATVLVQCRGWRQRSLDVDAVHDVHAHMLIQHAGSARILAIGDYTEPAWKLVVGKPVELIYGETLLNLLQEARQPPVPNVRTLSRPSTRHSRHQALRLVR